MFQKYCVVFQELFVVFADMGHRNHQMMLGRVVPLMERAKDKLKVR